MPNPTTAAEWARGFLASDGFALWVRGEADTGYLERLLANALDAYARQQVEEALEPYKAILAAAESILAARSDEEMNYVWLERTIAALREGAGMRG